MLWERGLPTGYVVVPAFAGMTAGAFEKSVLV
jgi:hypothetical protein